MCVYVIALCLAINLHFLYNILGSSSVFWFSSFRVCGCSRNTDWEVSACRGNLRSQSSRERGLSVSPATGQGSPWLPRSTSDDRLGINVRTRKWNLRQWSFPFQTLGKLKSWPWSPLPEEAPPPRTDSCGLLGVKALRVLWCFFLPPFKILKTARSLSLVFGSANPHLPRASDTPGGRSVPESQLCHLAAVCLWASCVTSLSLFLPLWMVAIYVPCQTLMIKGDRLWSGS